MPSFFNNSVNNLSGILAYIQACLTDPIVGFSFVGTVTEESVPFDIYKIKTSYNTTGLGSEEYTYVIFGVEVSKLYIGTCRFSDGITMTGKIAKSNLPYIDGISFPSRMCITANSKRVAIGLQDSAGLMQALYFSTVNFSALDQPNINALTNHSYNMHNNLQIVGKVGGNARLLYGGHGYGSEQIQYDQGVAFYDLTQVATDKKNVSTKQLWIETAAVKSESGEFYSVLDGIFMSAHTGFHEFDQPIDPSSNLYRYFRDSVSRSGIIVKESP